MLEPELTKTFNDEDKSPESILTSPPLFPKASFPPLLELEIILNPIVEFVLWVILQLLLFDTFTLVFELFPFPETIIFVPPPPGLELGAGVLEGFGLTDGCGEVDGSGEAEGFGDPDGPGELEGKTAAATKVLFIELT